MLKPKVNTIISRLMIGDYFVPEDENEVYDFCGYDDEWCLWAGINVRTGSLRMFDDMACIWYPFFDPKAIDEFWNNRENFLKSFD